MSVENVLVVIAGLILAFLAGAVTMFLVIRNNQRADIAANAKVTSVIAAIKGGVEDVEKIKTMLK